jgi:hypothetical protein
MGRPAAIPGAGMYVVVQHQFKDPQTAFSRGEKLIKNEGAPAGVRGLQFCPSRDGSAATCPWEADSVEAIQEYVDSTLGASSANTCNEVDTEQAFAERPLVGYVSCAAFPALATQRSGGVLRGGRRKRVACSKAYA